MSKTAKKNSLCEGKNRNKISLRRKYRNHIKFCPGFHGAEGNQGPLCG